MIYSYYTGDDTKQHKYLKKIAFFFFVNVILG